MQKINELPVYDALISTDDTSDIEMNFVALVDFPAIKKNFLAFSENKPLLFIDNERRIISGAFMLADTPIYRRDADGEEYYTVFRPETIYAMVQKFFKKGYQNNVNAMHDENLTLNNVVIFESFISDKSRGIMPMIGFEDAPEGSWFGSMHVQDDATWAKVRSGEFKGFSIEGFFTMKKSDKPVTEQALSDDDLLNKLKELLKQI